MNCAEAGNLIDAYVDDELDLVRSLEIESHMEECPACSQARQMRMSLRSRMRSAGLQCDAPAGLERRLRSALSGRERPSPWRWSIGWIAAAATVAAVVAAFLWLRPARAEDQLAREVVSTHIRSLMLSHLTDVPSSDQHTVKPWFNGKLDFSPPVKDLAAAGFPLAGGRLDYLGGRPVAALVYQHRKHVINVFIWPSAGGSDEAGRAEPDHGYNVLHWSRAGMTFWVVSDLNRSELEQFAALMR